VWSCLSCCPAVAVAGDAAAVVYALVLGLIGLGLAIITVSELGDGCRTNGCGEAVVHIVADDAATAAEEGDIGDEALGSCVECARNAARKLLRKGLWVVGIEAGLGCQTAALSTVRCCCDDSGLFFLLFCPSGGNLYGEGWLVIEWYGQMEAFRTTEVPI